MTVNAEKLDPLTYAVRLYKQGDAEEAETFIKKYLMNHPDDIRGWMTLAKMTEDLQVKRRSLERVLAKDPYHKQARDMLNVLLDVMPNMTEFGTESRVDSLTNKKYATMQVESHEKGKSRTITIAIWGLILFAVAVVIVVAFLVMQGQGMI